MAVFNSGPLFIHPDVATEMAVQVYNKRNNKMRKNLATGRHPLVEGSIGFLHGLTIRIDKWKNPRTFNPTREQTLRFNKAKRQRRARTGRK